MGFEIYTGIYDEYQTRQSFDNRDIPLPNKILAVGDLETYLRVNNYIDRFDRSVRIDGKLQNEEILALKAFESLNREAINALENQNQEDDMSAAAEDNVALIPSEYGNEEVSLSTLKFIQSDFQRKRDAQIYLMSQGLYDGVTVDGVVGNTTLAGLQEVTGQDNESGALDIVNGKITEYKAELLGRLPAIGEGYEFDDFERNNTQFLAKENPSQSSFLVANLQIALERLTGANISSSGDFDEQTENVLKNYLQGQSIDFNENNIRVDEKLYNRIVTEGINKTFLLTATGLSQYELSKDLNYSEDYYMVLSVYYNRLVNERGRLSKVLSEWNPGKNTAGVNRLLQGFVDKSIQTGLINTKPSTEAEENFNFEVQEIAKQILQLEPDSMMSAYILSEGVTYYAHLNALVDNRSDEFNGAAFNWNELHFKKILPDYYFQPNDGRGMHVPMIAFTSSMERVSLVAQDSERQKIPYSNQDLSKIVDLGSGERATYEFKDSYEDVAMVSTIMRWIMQDIDKWSQNANAEENERLTTLKENLDTAVEENDFEEIITLRYSFLQQNKQFISEETPLNMELGLNEYFTEKALQLANDINRLSARVSEDWIAYEESAWFPWGMRFPGGHERTFNALQILKNDVEVGRKLSFEEQILALNEVEEKADRIFTDYVGVTRLEFREKQLTELRNARWALSLVSGQTINGIVIEYRGNVASEVVDASFVDAIKSLQEANSLSITGKLDASTNLVIQTILSENQRFDTETNSVDSAFLAPNFSLAEMTATQQVNSAGEIIDNSIEDTQSGERDLRNLEQLSDILQIIRNNLRSDFPEYDLALKVNSAYRNEEVNTKVGGSLTSDHRLASAADIEVVNVGKKFLTDRELAGYIYDLQQKGLIPEDIFRQIIVEEDRSILHIAIHPTGFTDQKIKDNSFYPYFMYDMSSGSRVDKRYSATEIDNWFSEQKIQELNARV